VRARRHILASERRLRFKMGLPINNDRLLRPAQDPSLAKAVFDWDASTEEPVANLCSSETRLQYLPTERRQQLERHLIFHLSDAVSKVAHVYELVSLSLDRRNAARHRMEALHRQREDRGIILIGDWLDAQRQLEAAESDFFRHLAEYATSVKDVCLVAGCLPRYHNLDAAGTDSRIPKTQEVESLKTPSVESPVRKGASNKD